MATSDSAIPPIHSPPDKMATPDSTIPPILRPPDDMATLNSAIPPIFKLPPEILTEIFMLANNMRRKKTTYLSLALTCHHFHAVTERLLYRTFSGRHHRSQKHKHTRWKRILLFHRTVKENVSLRSLCREMRLDSYDGEAPILTELVELHRNSLVDLTLSVSPKEHVLPIAPAYMVDFRNFQNLKALTLTVVPSGLAPERLVPPKLCKLSLDVRWDYLRGTANVRRWEARPWLFSLVNHLIERDYRPPKLDVRIDLDDWEQGMDEALEYLLESDVPTVQEVDYPTDILTDLRKYAERSGLTVILSDIEDDKKFLEQILSEHRGY
ncbi:hypothetical protein EJ06DRAFT_80829 [Trichodelitschia bisporula]|uniref:F-box domain-containing protein n=1 Tax=Trichodelitschia bisporula TaxID=703511 RepID=A0A6G1HTC6_9PEZI|nr:hypothetical protein EJ06DRAFT_80829 [Trichodelitschia bisporula]